MLIRQHSLEEPCNETSFGKNNISLQFRSSVNEHRTMQLDRQMDGTD